MLKNFDDAQKQCCWVENGVRCTKKPALGSEKLSACTEHLEIHRKLSTEPDNEN